MGCVLSFSCDRMDSDSATHLITVDTIRREQDEMAGLVHKKLELLKIAVCFAVFLLPIAILTFVSKQSN